LLALRFMQRAFVFPLSLTEVIGGDDLFSRRLLIRQNKLYREHNLGRDSLN
jgi:hypothetical protein